LRVLALERVFQDTTINPVEVPPVGFVKDGS
jgi:hypothetical protein